MTTNKNEEKVQDCSTAGKGFARTGNTEIASESCGLPNRGFGNTDFGKKKEVTSEDNSQTDLSTAGMGFARTDKCKIVPENCVSQSKGFGTTDFGKEK